MRKKGEGVGVRASATKWAGAGSHLPRLLIEKSDGQSAGECVSMDQLAHLDTCIHRVNIEKSE